MDRVPEQYLKKLAGATGSWEIRAQIGGASYRFLGFFDTATLFILTNAVAKKQQKTPFREIELSSQRRKDHLERRKP
jgi:phage-related protein